MATIQYKCPHCAREGPMRIRTQLGPMREYNQTKQYTGWLGKFRSTANSTPPGMFSYFDDVAAFGCTCCHVDCGGPMVLIGAAKQIREVDWQKDIQSISGSFIFQCFPENPSVRPDGVPEKAWIYYIESEEDMRRGREPSRIISSCRTILDL